MNSHPRCCAVCMAALALFCSVTSAVAAATRPSSATTVTLEPLGAVPPRNDTVAFSPDGRHVVYITTQSGRSSVVLDGQPGPKFDDILTLAPLPEAGTGFDLREVSKPSATAPRTALISADSERLAYIARRGAQQFAVMEGREGPGYAEITSCGFSRDGSCFAYVAKTAEGQTHVVVDDVVSPGFDSVESFVFSATGGHHAYAATRPGADGEPASVLVVDGREQPGVATAGIAALTFSRDGRRFACALTQGRGNATVFADGKKGKRYFQIDHVMFSDDGRHLIYTARKDFSRGCVVVDGVEKPWSPVDDEHGRHRLFVSADGARIAYVKANGRQFSMVVDGEERAPCDAIERASFGPDGRRFVHVEHRADRYQVVDDGQESLAYAAVDALQFSADGSRLAFVAQSEKGWNVVVDGTAGRTYTAVAPASLQLSADGQHVQRCLTACCSKQRTRCVHGRRPARFSRDQEQHLHARDLHAGERQQSFLDHVRCRSRLRPESAAPRRAGNAGRQSARSHGGRALGRNSADGRRSHASDRGDREPARRQAQGQEAQGRLKW